MITIIPNFKDIKIDYDADLIVQLTRMFSRQESDFELLIVNQIPNIRHHLRDAGLVGIPMWDAFDEIQNIQVSKSVPYAVADLIMPRTALPSFREDAVRYYLNGNLYATVNLRGNEGYVWTVDYARQSNGERLTEHYDDRGFLSFKTWENDANQVVRGEWFDFDGELVATQNSTGKIQISEKSKARIGQSTFKSMDELVSKVTMNHLVDKKIRLSIGVMNPELVLIRNELSQIEKFVYLIDNQQPRFDSLQLMEPKDILIVPTESDRARLASYFEKIKVSDVMCERIFTLPTQTSELDLGSSNEMALMEISWYTGDASASFVDKTYLKILPSVSKHEDKSLKVFASSEDEIERLESLLSAWVSNEYEIDLDGEEYKDLEKYLLAKEKQQLTVDMENKMSDRKKLPSWDIMVRAYNMINRISHVITPQLKEMMHNISKARVFVDSSIIPKTQFQILAVSAAAPQINRQHSDYLIEGENGKVVSDESELVGAIIFYLDTLSNWNKTVVFNAHLIEDNAEDRVFSHWQEVL